MSPRTARTAPHGKAQPWSTAPVLPLAPEVEARLARERNVWLCTLRPDGSAHVTPVWFLYDAATWWISSAQRSVKVRNVLADARVSLALQDGDAPVVAEGVAHAHVREFPSRVVSGFAEKYGGWDITDPRQEPIGARVLLEVPVSRWLLSGVAR